MEGSPWQSGLLFLLWSLSTPCKVLRCVWGHYAEPYSSYQNLLSIILETYVNDTPLYSILVSTKILPTIFLGHHNLEKDSWWVSLPGKLNHFGLMYTYLRTWKWDSTSYVLQNCLLHLGMACWWTSTKNTPHCVPFGIILTRFFFFLCVSLAVLQSKYRQGRWGEKEGSGLQQKSPAEMKPGILQLYLIYSATRMSHFFIDCHSLMCLSLIYCGNASLEGGLLKITCLMGAIKCSKLWNQTK